MFIVRDDSRQADIAVPDLRHDVAGLQPVRRRQLVLRRPDQQRRHGLRDCAGPRGQGELQPARSTRARTSPQSFLFNAEYPMMRFLEANGYNVKYWSGVDTDRFGATPDWPDQRARSRRSSSRSATTSTGRAGSGRNVENARNAGVNLAFFSGNEVYWKTRWEPSDRRHEAGHRTLVGYKDTLAGVEDSIRVPNAIVDGHLARHALRPAVDGGRPENALDRHDLDGQLAAPRRSRSRRRWPVCASGGTRASPSWPPADATLAPDTLGYEWGEALDNGFRPAGLVRLSSTTLTTSRRSSTSARTSASAPATHT